MDFPLESLEVSSTTEVDSCLEEDSLEAASCLEDDSLDADSFSVED